MRTLCRVLVLALAASTSLLMAAFINPGFETGDLTGWSAANSTIGTPSDCSPALFLPYRGSFLACMEAGSVDVGTAEFDLGLTPGTLVGIEPLVSGGAILYQTVSMAANETLTEWAYFQSIDTLPYNDFAFWSFVGPDTNTAGVIASVTTVRGLGGSGWIPVSFTAPSAGDYTIGFGVFNAGPPIEPGGPPDNASSSFLGVDAPLGTETPEPGTLALLGLGLVGLACFRRRRA